MRSNETEQLSVSVTSFNIQSNAIKNWNVSLNATFFNCENLNETMLWTVTMTIFVIVSVQTNLIHSNSILYTRQTHLTVDWTTDERVRLTHIEPSKQIWQSRWKLIMWLFHPTVFWCFFLFYAKKITLSGSERTTKNPIHIWRQVWK